LTLPGVPGIEAVGVVEEVGDGVVGWCPGDRLAYVAREYGGYSSARTLSAGVAIRLPNDIDDLTAGAMMVRGLTVEMLTDALHRLQPDETILVHATAGGVGRLLVQSAARIGARIIGTVGSEEKAKIAREAGAHETILYRSVDFVARVREFTEGEGVDMVYDSVGHDTVSGSLEALKPCGHLVLFGQSSGARHLNFCAVARGQVTYGVAAGPV
jgi:NADPH2:quinone reductase